MKRLLAVMLSLSLVVPINSYAKCDNEVTLLNRGDIAPCRGFLFSPEKEQEVYIIKEDYKLLEKKLEFKDKTIKLLQKDVLDVETIVGKEQEKSELWRNLAEKNTLLLIKENKNRGKRDFWMIILGVALTVGAGHAVGAASR